MQINKITNACIDATKKIGTTIIESGKNQASKGAALRKINNLVQGEGYNPGRPAYYFLMSACVIFPRLLQAREPDEFREILTRDAVSVLTILFAMKGLKSGMCMAASKKGGIALVKDSVGKDASVFKKALGYLNPEGGISALSSREILTRYSNIKDKDTLVKTLDMVDKEGGSIAKMFNIENTSSLIDNIAQKLNIKQTNKQTPLYDAAIKMFGGEFTEKTNAELLDAVKNISRNNKTATEGLEAIIGAPAKEGKEAIKGILNDKNNPITKYARNINANFETISLAITAGFLGFGLPKLNEKLTMKKHLTGPNKNALNEKIQENAKAQAKPFIAPANGLIYKSVKNDNSKNTNPFRGFIA